MKTAFFIALLVLLVGFSIYVIISKPETVVPSAPQTSSNNYLSWLFPDIRKIFSLRIDLPDIGADGDTDNDGTSPALSPYYKKITIASVVPGVEGVAGELSLFAGPDTAVIDVSPWTIQSDGVSQAIGDAGRAFSGSLTVALPTEFLPAEGGFISLFDEDGRLVDEYTY